MSRKGSRRRRHLTATTQGGGAAIALKQPPWPPVAAPRNPAQLPAGAVPLPRREEPLVMNGPAPSETLTPLPRSLSLVDPRMPITRRLRFWFLAAAERWVERRKPLPEAPTLAQLDKLRKELASVQRKLDRMLG